MTDTTRTPAERRAFEKIEAERHAQAQWLGIDSHGQDLPAQGGVIDVPAGRGVEFGDALVADAARHLPKATS